MTVPTLSIDNLKLSFKNWRGSVAVLHGISIDVFEGEKVALVGESGSGKSVTAKLVLGLLQNLSSSVIDGDLRFEGKSLNSLHPSARRSLRGTRMSMIFQDPTSSLNPVFMIGEQFHEVLKRSNKNISRDDAYKIIEKILAEVSIYEVDRVLNSYPFQLSGGMNQRVMIAMALVNEPSLLIADEPGTALDVTVQAQTLDLMKNLVENHRTSVLFISHNLGVVREFADRVYVIYRGRIVEQGPVDSVFKQPLHPYTRALLAAVPRITGEGIPEINDDPDQFSASLQVH